MSEVIKNKGSKVGAWISAMRLRTLPLSFSVILMGSALAYSAQHATYPPYQYSWLTFSLILITTLLLQILSNLANDYGDAKKGADNEGRIGPVRAIQSGIISPQEMFKGIVITSLLALISGIWLLLEAFDYNLNGTFILFIVLGLASIAAAIKYTVGKRAYGYSGLGDLFVFMFFGLVGVLGTFYLQTKMLAWPALFPAITMGCLSVAVLNLNNMRDRENDQKVGKNTLVVKFGFAWSKSYHYTLFLIAYLVFPIPILFSILMGGDFQFFLPFIPILIIHIIHIRKVIRVKDPKDFDPELKKIALSAFLLSLLFFAMVLTVF
ncbi:MAG: 1,4-dihydroxy-2-naphthoate octaprenyltransferase [Crocinitomix sp.]|nr:1,4-dihydroxy-2-naphthoate octaprenyltransferase [Crocinitomix sp.]